MITKAQGDVYCSSCGMLGQLVLHKTRASKSSLFYYYVNHFKNKKGKLKTRIPLRRMKTRYAYCCYLGKIVITDEVYNIIYPQPSLVAVSIGRHFL